MDNYKVMEYRGCGIQYPQFFGTYEECQDWIDTNCAIEYYCGNPVPQMKDEDGNWECNGDGIPFSYGIEIDAE